MKTVLYFFVAVSFFFMVPFPFGSAEEVVVDVEKAVRMAFENNLSLKSEQLTQNQKKRGMENSWNSLLPTLSASAGLSRSNEASASTPWSLSVGITASLTLNAGIFFSMKQTALDYEAGLIALEQAKQQMQRDIKKAFYNLLLLEENLNMYRQSMDTAEKRYIQSKTNYDYGRVSRYTMLSAQVAWENMKPTLRDMELRYREAVESFKDALGINPADSVRLEGAIEVQDMSFDADALITKYMTDRLDIQAIRQRRKVLENTIGSAIASLTPSLTFRFSMDPTFRGDPFADPWFADVSNDWKQRSGAFSMALSVPLDGLIPGSKTQTSIANAEDSIRQNDINLSQSLKKASMEITNIVKRLEKSLLSLNTLKLNVELALEAYKLAEESYNAGGKEILEVQNAELELQKAKLSVLTEEYNYVSGLLDLEYALNTKLDERGAGI